MYNPLIALVQLQHFIRVYDKLCNVLTVTYYIAYEMNFSYFIECFVFSV